MQPEASRAECCYAVFNSYAVNLKLADLIWFVTSIFFGTFVLSIRINKCTDVYLNDNSCFDNKYVNLKNSDNT